MRNTLRDFKRRALARPELLDEILKARANAGLTQAELAERIGTTQSAH